MGFIEFNANLSITYTKTKGFEMPVNVSQVRTSKNLGLASTVFNIL